MSHLKTENPVIDGFESQPNSIIGDERKVVTMRVCIRHINKSAYRDCFTEFLYI